MVAAISDSRPSTRLFAANGSAAKMLMMPAGRRSAIIGRGKNTMVEPPRGVVTTVPA